MGLLRIVTLQSDRWPESARHRGDAGGGPKWSDSSPRGRARRPDRGGLIVVVVIATPRGDAGPVKVRPLYRADVTPHDVLTELARCDAADRARNVQRRGFRVSHCTQPPLDRVCPHRDRRSKLTRLQGQGSRGRRHITCGGSYTLLSSMRPSENWTA